MSIRLAITIQRNTEITPKKKNMKEINLEKERGFDGVRISDEATRLLL
jgi:hypothetical protein